MQKTTLKRSIGLPLLTLFGLGTILGAGIYVLIGEVAGETGTAAPSAFVVAAVLAGLTAFSYAELVSRLPLSAGEAAYVDAGFGRPFLTGAVGWAVIAIGTVSAATMSRGVVGYLGIFVDAPTVAVLLVTISLLGALAIWGISESTTAAAIVTILEVAGLALVCVVARDAFTALPLRWPELLPEVSSASMAGLIAGAFVAFYAFIGFEDIVNIAEEVKNPTRTVPRAIVLSLSAATLAYVLVSSVAVLSLAPAELAASAAPLAAVVEAPGISARLIALISLLAVMNGGLVQIIMASRVLYGLALQGLAWHPFARVHAKTRTPALGTLAVTAAIAGLALFLSLGELARLTSLLTLLVFALVNAALWRLKRRAPGPAAYRVPIAVPITGCMACTGIVCYQALSYLT